MKNPLIIHTKMDGLVLREMASLKDDIAYFDALNASKDLLMPFESETFFKYPDLQSVTEARLQPSNPDKVRLAIWKDETFVGSANLVPEDNAAEIGYWLHINHTGNGYATVAARSIAQFATKKYNRVYAEILDGNSASEKVLLRAGFIKTAQQLGKITFDYLQE